MVIEVSQPKTKEDWDQYFLIRWETLRKPWNQPKGSELDSSDDTSIHRMIMVDEKIVGVGRIHLNSSNEAQIRFMGVSDPYRKLNLGSKLLAELEKIAIQKNAKKVILHSRDYAIPFYESNDYLIVKKTYLLFDEIQHYLMEKILN